MARALPLALLSALIAAALPLGRPRAQQAPAAAPAAPVQDPAATGFLRSKVDARVYSLEEAGARRLKGIARARFEADQAGAAVKPGSCELVISCDYASGKCDAKAATAPTADQLALLPFAVAAAQNAFSRRPSRLAADWSTTFARDGELVRIDYKPPQSAGDAAGGWSEWYRLDGTPTRRRIASYAPVGGGATRLVEQEILPTWSEHGGRLLLSSLEPSEGASRFSYSFEYAEKEGWQILKRLVLRNEGWKLTLDFELTVEKAGG